MERRPIVRGMLVVVALGAVMSFLVMRGRAPGRIPPPESMAARSLSHIVGAQEAYAHACGNGGYAASLAALATPTPGGTGPYLGLAPGQEPTPVRDGYRLSLGPGASSTQGPTDCNGTATVTAWYATAVPERYGVTGQLSFAVNASGEIWQQDSPRAPTEPFGWPARRR